MHSLERIKVLLSNGEGRSPVSNMYNFRRIKLERQFLFFLPHHRGHRIGRYLPLHNWGKLSASESYTRWSIEMMQFNDAMCQCVSQKDHKHLGGKVIQTIKEITEFQTPKCFLIESLRSWYFTLLLNWWCKIPIIFHIVI